MIKLKQLFCWHNFVFVCRGYVGYVIVECVKCGRRKCVEGMEEVADIAKGRRRYTEAQNSAIVKAILDSDYTEMNRLKADGQWIKPEK